MNDIFKTLKELCSLCGISGNEDNVREYIYNEILPYADEIKTDGMGNLIVHKYGKQEAKNKIMLAAHMDEVGLMISSIEKNGLLRFECIGGIDERILPGKRVKIGEHYGVIGIKPIHLSKGEERERAIGIDNLYIDIGAKDEKDAKKSVDIGDAAIFDTQYEDFGDNLIKARALDDRCGCALMINMIKSELLYDMYFAFTVQEEIGLRGARAASFGIDPEYAIVLETTTAADIAGVVGSSRVCILGNGPAISFMDRRTIYDRELFDLAFRLSEENNIKCQAKTQVAGGNDAGVIHISNSGIKTMAISMPCRYLHSPACIINKDDLIGMAKLAKLCAENIAGGLE